MTTITIEEARARLAQLIDQLGPGEELGIMRGDSIVARIVGEQPKTRRRPGPGLGKGMISIVAADDEDLKDFAEYMP